MTGPASRPPTRGATINMVRPMKLRMVAPFSKNRVWMSAMSRINNTAPKPVPNPTAIDVTSNTVVSDGCSRSSRLLKECRITSFCINKYLFGKRKISQHESLMYLSVLTALQFYLKSKVSFAFKICPAYLKYWAWKYSCFFARVVMIDNVKQACLCMKLSIIDRTSVPRINFTINMHYRSHHI
jgi:hypothetical protein